MFCCNSRDDGKLRPNNTRKESRQVQISAPWEAVQVSPATDTDIPGKPVGVGIVFQPDSTGALHVKSLAVGGPAEQSALVHIGDILHEIDGHQVFRKPASQLAPLILGQEGSRVRLGFSREKFPRLIYVDLRRGWSLQSGQAPDGTIPATPTKGFSHPLPEVSPPPPSIFLPLSISLAPDAMVVRQGARLSFFPGPLPVQADHPAAHPAAPPAKPNSQSAEPSPAPAARTSASPPR
jgi:hypothetical protein